MLVSFQGDNYKDAEKVNKHIKEVAVEQLPVNESLEDLIPELTPQNKYAILLALGFKVFDKREFTHPVFNDGSYIQFDINTDDIKLLSNKIYKMGWQDHISQLSQQIKYVKNV